MIQELHESISQQSLLRKPNNKNPMIKKSTQIKKMNLLTGPTTQIAPHETPSNARPAINVKRFGAIIIKSHPQMKGIETKIIVFLRPIMLDIFPVLRQPTTAEMFIIELIDAHSTLFTLKP